MKPPIYGSNRLKPEAHKSSNDYLAREVDFRRIDSPDISFGNGHRAVRAQAASFLGHLQR